MFIYLVSFVTVLVRHRLSESGAPHYSPFRTHIFHYLKHGQALWPTWSMEIKYWLLTLPPRLATSNSKEPGRCSPAVCPEEKEDVSVTKAMCICGLQNRRILETKEPKISPDRYLLIYRGSRPRKEIIYPGLQCSVVVALGLKPIRSSPWMLG